MRANVTQLWRRFAPVLCLLMSLAPLISADNPSSMKDFPYSPDWTNLIDTDVYDYSRLKKSMSNRPNIFEGDIRIPTGPPSDTMVNPNDEKYATDGRPWDQGIVPFDFAVDHFTREQQSFIRDSLQKMEANTCLQFTPVREGASYILFAFGNDGSSFFGHTNEPQQVIYLDENSFCAVGEVQHLVMHALGFGHEQSREDRDNYIDIVWQNIPSGFEIMFNKYKGRTFNLPYDYKSIMHYAHNEFSREPYNAPTILPKSTAAIGNRKELSEIDIQRINALYPCHSGTTASPKPVSRKSHTRSNKTPTTTEAIFPNGDDQLTPGTSRHPHRRTTVDSIQRNSTILPVVADPVVPDFFCYFYTNLTYTCKTSCEGSGGERRFANFTSDARRKYYDMDCAADVLLPSEKRWEIGKNSLVPKVFNADLDTEILATCAFYNSLDFDCNGVTDCMEANNENRCGSAAPWSGRYLGSPEQGLKLNGTINKTGSDAGGG
ncbi:putative Zinc metalloproteinase nas-7 [Hypsibius exemplaris]|uniref:Metalloendopeptidase n=1 Tax=Hypsibius exemplaris TaxID=2072580 RepID=A0A9X6RLF6_HYPEX|nr:putative Zinc metalloproteinase nas-7 [Hypsibius exemplaris]